LLSFTASRLWELRDRHFHRLTRKSYDAIGGVEGALAGHAEETLLACTAEEQKLVREAFRHLVTAEGTRAVLTRAELADVLGRGARADAVIERLVAARLLVATEDADGAETIEVIHEALLSAWPRLVEWRRDDADGARLRDQLRAAARQWQDRGRPRGLLWRDDALDDYRRWRARWPGALPDLDESFAAASLRDARRGRTIRRSLAATALAVLLAGTVSLALLYRSSQHNAARATASAAEADRRLVESYLEQGRRYLLDGEYLKALPYLSAAYAGGADTTELRFLLARALRWAGAEVASRHHDAPAEDAAFRAGGTQILSVDQHGGAVVWNAATGVSVASLPAPSPTTIHPRVAPDGSFAVIPLADRVVVWDGAASRELRIPGVQQVAIDPTAKTCVTVADARVDAWDVATLAKVWTARLPPSSSIALLSGRVVARGDDNQIHIVGPDAQLDLPGSVAIRDYAASGTEVATIRGVDLEVWTLDGAKRWSATAESELRTVSFSPDGTRVAAVARDGTVIVHDSADGRLLHVLSGRADIPNLELDRDGRRLAEIGDDLVLTIWDLATGREIELTGPAGGIFGFHFDASGERIVTASADGGVRLFSTQDPDLARQLRLDIPLITSDLSGGGSILLGGSGEQIRTWDATTGRELSNVNDGVALRGSPHISDTGALLAIPMPEGNTVEIRDSEGSVRAIIRADAAVSTAELDPAGRQVVTADENGQVDVWNIDGTHRASLRGHTNTVVSAAFRDDGGAVVTAALDRTVRVWDTATGRSIDSFEHPDEVLMARFDRSGTRVVSACGDKLARIWDLHTGEARAYEHRSLVTAVDFSRDGMLIAGASQVGSVRVWDVATGVTVADFSHAAFASDVEFLPGGDLLFSGSSDRTASFWRIDATLPPVETVTAFVRCHSAFGLADTRLTPRRAGSGCDASP
jgi:WD40 repeat protein